MMKARKRKVAIYERDNDAGHYWMVDPPGGLHDTAADALAWVTRQDAAEAEGGTSVITVIEWHTVSRIGRDVVHALGGGKHR